MNIVEIILKKRNGDELQPGEIDYFVRGYSEGMIPDYQAAALLMAIWFRGMTPAETTALTLSMRDSGDVVDLSGIKGIKADKHSTGGVADGTTLIVTPLVAACGGKVAKMSGRGLGHTGGTLDKLESIPGFSTSLSEASFFEVVEKCGFSVIGQTANLVPADKKLYALRDVTGTIDNISLIAGSIMSKKLASGSDVIVLDVKTGSGAFMKELSHARSLAETMVKIGEAAGKRTAAVITDMNQPLGDHVGNTLEIVEAVEVLSGRKGGDLLTVAETLAMRMLMLSNICETEQEAREMIGNALESGAALKSLASMIQAHGGDPGVVNDTGLLPSAAKKISVKSQKSGFITGVKTDDVGIAALLLGAGRLAKSDPIDPAVGIVLKKRMGDFVGDGEELAVFHVNSEDKLSEAVERFLAAYTIEPNKSQGTSLIYDIIE